MNNVFGRQRDRTDLANEIVLLLLNVENLGFDGVLSNQLIDVNWFLLANTICKISVKELIILCVRKNFIPVASVDSLEFDTFLPPPRVYNVNDISSKRTQHVRVHPLNVQSGKQ